MKLADEFSRDVRRALKGRFSELEWRVNWRPRGIRYESVDVVALHGDGTPVLLLEVELKRQDPVSNLVKIWKWFDEGKFGQKVTFVQAFSKHFRESKREHMDRALFAARRMRREHPSLKYEKVLLDYKPRRGRTVGAGRRRHHAHALADKIAKNWKKLT